MFYKNVCDIGMDAILITDPDGNILSANRSACSMFEKTEEEICSIGRFDLFDRSDPNLKVFLEDFANNKKSKGELTFLKSNGSKFPGEVSFSEFIDENGKIKNSLIIRDISDWRKAEEELNRSQKEFRSYFESSSIGLSVTAPDMTWIEVNPKLCQMLGYTKED